MIIEPFIGYRNLHGQILDEYNACVAGLQPPPPPPEDPVNPPVDPVNPPTDPVNPPVGPVCGTGYHLEYGMCVPDMVAPPKPCDPGYHSENGNCVKDAVIIPGDNEPEMTTSGLTVKPVYIILAIAAIFLIFNKSSKKQ